MWEMGCKSKSIKIYRREWKMVRSYVFDRKILSCNTFYINKQSLIHVYFRCVFE